MISLTFMMVLMQMQERLDSFAVLIQYQETVLVISPHQATSCMSSWRLIIQEVERDLRQGSTQLKKHHQVKHFVWTLMALRMNGTSRLRQGNASTCFFSISRLSFFDKNSSNFNIFFSQCPSFSFQFALTIQIASSWTKPTNMRAFRYLLIHETLLSLHQALK